MRTCKVIVNGQLMTYNNRKKSVIECLEQLGNNWSTTDTILAKAVSMKLMEKKNDKRIKAHSHPIWKIMTTMSDEENSPLYKRFNKNGILEYKLKKPQNIYVNGNLME